MPANAMITYSGNVFWPVPTKLLSTCKVDVTYFPFDEQFCLLKFGSWTYDGFQVTDCDYSAPFRTASAVSKDSNQLSYLLKHKH